MVVFVDYDQQDANSTTSSLHSHHQKAIFLKHPGYPIFAGSHGSGGNGISRDKNDDKRADTELVMEESPAVGNGNDADCGQWSNPNRNGFSAALSCYPVVVQIARSVDLNTLDSLSMTCRQFRANLLPFRSQLVRETLRCRNEPLDDALSNRNGDGDNSTVLGFAAAEDAPDVFQSFPQPTTTASSIDRSSSIRRFTTGKVGRCARDMVAECQRCMYVYCRNCTMKPIGASLLKSRFRRLCPTCLAAPLSDHFLDSVSSGNDSHDSNWNYPPLPAQTKTQVFTGDALDLNLCHCDESFWLCRPCGHILRSDDTTYKRVWTWRTRYSAYLGCGLGTGIGEGWQGVKCGRGEGCLAAEELEMEVDCEVDDWMSDDADHINFISHPHNNRHGNNGGNDNHAASRQNDDGHGDEEPGYLRQEIEGVGGVVKQKVKKRLKVGACVEEHEDERETASYLKREYLGDVRSWCGWCQRVVPCHKEREHLE
ncbi:hypothetical protein I7I51_01552 [Histoplasma capsulatum]|uniref:Uncharacterized protein n=1 Tax=Ajellomyces capsulatus TaxID=5037 RepID=A0A8A1MIQ9_AJECA|nr:hypothetical protein I7I51_01552 [Histoplasma capsulatum]